MTRIFERDTAPENAWRVTVDKKGRLNWSNDEETVSRQPARGFWQRVQDFFYILVPASQI
jgi:hypothetical protein